MLSKPPKCAKIDRTMPFACDKGGHKMRKWIAVLAISAIAAMSSAGAVAAEDNIQIIGTDESVQATEAAAISADAQGAADASSTGETGTDAAADAAASSGTETAAADQAGSSESGSGETSAEDAAQTAAVSQEPSGILNPADEKITSEEAVSNARTLYSQMQHYADINDNTSFAALFEPGADAQVIQDQLQTIKSSLSEIKNLGSHADLCFFDPTQDSSQSPYYFAVALCDYDVDVSGAVSWYSVLMKVAKYEDGWHVSVSPAGDLLEKNYPEAFTAASNAGYNAKDLYPSLGMRFASGAVFNGTLYALPNLLWQNEAGELSCAVWVANGTDISKWCDTIDLIVEDKEAGDITRVNVPVQTALEPGQSTMVICTIPAEYVDSGKKAWTEVTVSSNLRYQ